MQTTDARHPVARFTERVGRRAVEAVEGLGRAGGLVADSLFWLLAGPRLGQPVRVGSVFVQMMEIGVKALPIIALLGGTIGVMLAIQGIHTLGLFGAESRVVIGIALSVTREFAPLITAILVAGRSGSALAARLGTMKISQEIDALHVMGIHPVRYLVVTWATLLAMLVMLPALTLFSNFVGLYAAGLYVGVDLGICRRGAISACTWWATSRASTLSAGWNGAARIPCRYGSFYGWKAGIVCRTIPGCHGPARACPMRSTRRSSTGFWL